MTVCPKCSNPAASTTGKELYPKYPATHGKRYFVCWVCDTRAPRGQSGQPAARMANAHTRRLRQLAHEAFDPLWKTKRMTRNAAYAWLRKALGLSERDCHMSWMSDGELVAVVELSTDKMLELRRAKENPA